MTYMNKTVLESSIIFKTVKDAQIKMYVQMYLLSGLQVLCLSNRDNMGLMESQEVKHLSGKCEALPNRGNIT
jgi:hypothetical protein